MQFYFDASKVEPARALEPVPTDWYLAKLVDSELTKTKDQQGEYFNGEIQLLAGPFAGRKVFCRHNTKNANPVAVEIGMKEVSALCHATGVMQIADTAQLHDRPFEVRVILRPAEGQYDATNEVKGYRAVGSGKQPAGNGGAGGPPPSPVAPGPSFAPPPVGMPSFAPPAPPAAPAFAPPPSFAPPPAAPSFGPPSFPGAPPAGYPPQAPAPMAPPPPPPPPPVQAAPPPPPPPPARPRSPDGKYEWDGAQWLPVAAAPVQAVPSAPPPAGGVPSWAK